MVRPNKTRNTKSLRRDIETLSRLRTSIQLDSSIEESLVKIALNKIDNLSEALFAILRVKEGFVYNKPRKTKVA